MKKTDFPFKSTVQRSVYVALCCIAFCLTSPSLANDKCDDESFCIEQNSWQVGVAIGIGGRSNPLVDGDAIPYIILPDIAYYGESFYFDNAETGFQFYPSQRTSLEIYVVPNAERANFSFWHPSNIFIPAAGFESVDDPEALSGLSDDQTVSVNDVSTRKWALDAGLRVQWFDGAHNISASIAHDVSGVYQGLHATAQYVFTYTAQDWRLSLSPHVKWVSDELSNYYYGVGSEDTAFPELVYSADAGLQFGLNINGAFQIDEHWQWIATASYIKLHSGMSDSPLVENDYITSAFVGIAYRF
ncbi:MipA/OmpV family protein [Ningiella sp. W23]|uniref:MipA/OmpV family protein n=1 Tax=Ningiella sp. W23 TaxID=3023715 RepID=UPI003757EE1C